ncbi:MAG TPA: hypothetical protein VK281_05315 [Xanthobacteraceae bacterium]|nr:hypothetical protein [Xanthobacteraceae bacterium]
MAAAVTDFHDLHQAMALPKATLTRFLRTLDGHGLVWRRIADGAYARHLTNLQKAVSDIAARMLSPVGRASAADGARRAVVPA